MADYESKVVNCNVYELQASIDVMEKNGYTLYTMVPFKTSIAQRVCACFRRRNVATLVEQAKLIGQLMAMHNVPGEVMAAILNKM